MVVVWEELVLGWGAWPWLRPSGGLLLDAVSGSREALMSEMERMGVGGAGKMRPSALTLSSWWECEARRWVVEAWVRSETLSRRSVMRVRREVILESRMRMCSFRVAMWVVCSFMRVSFWERVERRAVSWDSLSESCARREVSERLPVSAVGEEGVIRGDDVTI